MVNIDLELSKDFLEPEYRDGFFVTRTRKELWAIQLDIVAKIKSICDENHLSWFLDGGSLLGAVRHKGFIPWDDDFDIMMPRIDYDIFLQKATDYFKEPYFVQTDYTDVGFFNCIKIRRSDTTALTMGIDDKKGIGSFSAPIYNGGIFVDIFPMDKAPNEPRLHTMFMNELSQIKMLGQNVREFIKRKNPFFKNDCINLMREISKTYDNMRIKFENTDTKYYAQTTLPQSKNTIKHVSDYSEVIYLPFEFMSLPCPKNYDEALTDIYGDDYMTPKQGLSKHGTLFVDTNNPYTNYHGKCEILLSDNMLVSDFSGTDYSIDYYEQYGY